jgi:ketosteroid isomerase-like protein
VDIKNFRTWLSQYGQAWINGDPEAAIELFSENAAYYEEPFQAPMKGREAIRKYWEDGAQNAQMDITFKADIISIQENSGYAHWQATFKRIPANTFVELDGILKATFNVENKCIEFRDWWHRREK